MADSEEELPADKSEAALSSMAGLAAAAGTYTAWLYDLFYNCDQRLKTVITVLMFYTGVSFTYVLLVFASIGHASNKTMPKIDGLFPASANVSSSARGQEIEIRFAAAEREGNDRKDCEDVRLEMAQAKARIWP